MVTFIIGAEGKQERFTVHKEHACRYSPVLNRAFNGNFAEGHTQEYTSHDFGPASFRMFVQWLYTQKVNLLAYTEEKKILDERTECLTRLWVLSDNLLVPRLQDIVIEHLLTLTEVRPEAILPQIPYIYHNTACDSPLRRVAVERCAWGINAPTSYRDIEANLPKEFFIDLVDIFGSVVPIRARKSYHKKLSSRQSDYFQNQESVEDDFEA